MTSDARAYPLHWPPTVPRRAKRGQSKFDRKLSLSRALADLSDEVARLGGTGMVVSSNATLTNPRPADPAVAVYFVFRGRPHCLPCDAWDRLQCNVRAIAKHIEALRGIARWGVHNLEQAFAGFAALPTTAGGRGWREVLGLPADVRLRRVEERFRVLAKKKHPDVGGDPEEWLEIEQARQAARVELAAQPPRISP